MGYCRHNARVYMQAGGHVHFAAAYTTDTFFDRKNGSTTFSSSTVTALLPHRPRTPNAHCFTLVAFQRSLPTQHIVFCRTIIRSQCSKHIFREHPKTSPSRTRSTAAHSIMTTGRVSSDFFSSRYAMRFHQPRHAYCTSARIINYRSVCLQHHATNALQPGDYCIDSHLPRCLAARPLHHSFRDILFASCVRIDVFYFGFEFVVHFFSMCLFFVLKCRFTPGLTSTRIGVFASACCAVFPAIG